MSALYGIGDEAVTTINVDALRPGPSPRDANNLRHVGTLAELDGAWEPIVVNRQTMEVVDGRHRLAAAKQLGHRTIAVTFFDGNDAEARMEAVRLNVRHGLPLTLSERSTAARDLLALFPSWSDRQMGTLCALSPRTIARIRAEAPPPSGRVVPFPTVAVDKRLGKDGRHYPVAAGAQRAEIRKALEEDPDASLRAIAARTGASPETVRAVRRSISADEPMYAPIVLPVHPTALASPSQWSTDSACSSTEAGRDFATWFDGLQLDPGTVEAMVAAIPLSRIYGVIDEARRRATLWEGFANAVQSRACRRR